MLRFTNVIGLRIDTALSWYFALPVVPTVLGYDGRMPLGHEEDALAVLELTTRERLLGVFNVDGDGGCCCMPIVCWTRPGCVPSSVLPPGGPLSRRSITSYVTERCGR
ncbi:MAG TPA: hypothetical protein VJT72_15235 [Pseudonocardiaceae bacterium]|nr:hypothetical protein [Pseudonocardiaceae bacterium]